MKRFNILADASLPSLNTAFPPPFTLTLYHNEQELRHFLPNHNILFCRSTLKVTAALLEQSALNFVATASSGIDHLDGNYLEQQGIAIVDAKGCNAHAVADYVAASIAYLRSIHKFTGTKAGVIGLGKVGTEVAKHLATLNLDLVLYDPPKAARASNFISAPQTALYNCDLITLHPNLHSQAPYPSYHLINATFLQQLKPGCIIINTARGDVVNETDLLSFNGQFSYCTDVFSNEPIINPAVVDFATICTPHIAGLSIEARSNAVMMVSAKLHRACQLPLPAQLKPHLSLQEVPRYARDDEGLTRDDMGLNWQQILSLYNPIHETRLLKASQGEDFLTLRQAHTHRHNFSHSFNKLRITS